jgi:hypothetical protein
MKDDKSIASMAGYDDLVGGISQILEAGRRSAAWSLNSIISAVYREPWTHADENPGVGLIHCAGKNAAVAKYSSAGLPNKVLASEHRRTLPEEKLLAAEIKKARKTLDARL